MILYCLNWVSMIFHRPNSTQEKLGTFEFAQTKLGPTSWVSGFSQNQSRLQVGSLLKWGGAMPRPGHRGRLYRGRFRGIGVGCYSPEERLCQPRNKLWQPGRGCPRTSGWGKQSKKHTPVQVACLPKHQYISFDKGHAKNHSKKPLPGNRWTSSSELSFTKNQQIWVLINQSEFLPHPHWCHWWYLSTGTTQTPFSIENIVFYWKWIRNWLITNNFFITCLL